MRFIGGIIAGVVAVGMVKMIKDNTTIEQTNDGTTFRLKILFNKTK